MPGADAEGVDRSLFWRAVFAVVALPFVVEFIVPWLIRLGQPGPRPIGLVIIAIGAALQLWTIRDFYVAGRGTLAPWSPPKHLVTVGLYRASRNPMYVAGFIILCGWAIAYGGFLWLYAGAVALASHVRVVTNEEPFLLRTHGDEWVAYRQRVPRWI